MTDQEDKQLWEVTIMEALRRLGKPSTDEEILGEIKKIVNERMMEN